MGNMTHNGVLRDAAEGGVREERTVKTRRCGRAGNSGLDDFYDTCHGLNSFIQFGQDQYKSLSG